MPLDLIFLDTNGSSVFTDWRYHRLTAIGESIEMCQVTFPEFSDPGTPIQTPGIITFPLAIKKGAECINTLLIQDIPRSSASAKGLDDWPEKNDDIFGT
jgi:hypothetical protein